LLLRVADRTAGNLVGDRGAISPLRHVEISIDGKLFTTYYFSPEQGRDHQVGLLVPLEGGTFDPRPIGSQTMNHGQPIEFVTYPRSSNTR
jgi:hypothetical protein